MFIKFMPSTFMLAIAGSHCTFKILPVMDIKAFFFLFSTKFQEDYRSSNPEVSMQNSLISTN